MAKNCEEELDKLTREFETFAYIVSHDLKAPVRAIGNLTEWIEEDLDGNFPGDSKENFRLLKTRTQRLTNMIDALLEFSRATRTQLETGQLNINEFIAQTVTALNKQQEINLHLSGEAVLENTYVNKLKFVLKELLKNAVAFNDKQLTEITVTLSETPEELHIAIADNGPGIPEPALDKIFTIFYTVQTKDQHDTTGAGLAIVNKMVNFVNGSIKITGTPEGGTRVNLSWPKTIHTDLQNL